MAVDVRSLLPRGAPWISLVLIVLPVEGFVSAGELPNEGFGRSRIHSAAGADPRLEFAQATEESRQREEQAWQRTRSQDTVEAYIKFLEDFPTGVHATQARKRESELENQSGSEQAAGAAPRRRRGPVEEKGGTEGSGITPSPDPPSRGPATTPPGVSSRTGDSATARPTTNFSWDYDPRSGRMSVTVSGSERNCLTSLRDGIGGVTAYRDGQDVRVNFEHRGSRDVQSYDMTLSEFCAASAEQLNTAAPARPTSTPVVQRPAGPEPGDVAPQRPRSSAEACATASLHGISRYCVSSTLAGQFGNTYGPAHLFDRDSGTAWVEGRQGPGLGEWIVVEFTGRRLVTGIVLRNGYQKNADIFYKNARVRRLELRFSSGESRTVSLADRQGEQTFQITPAVSAHWLQLVIGDVYRGTKYDDTAISDLDVVSQSAN